MNSTTVPPADAERDIAIAQPTVSAGPSTERQREIDKLFDAIKDKDIPKMKKILDENPDIVNMQNKEEGSPIDRPRDYLLKRKLGNLLTQDILRHLQNEDIEVEEYGQQRPLHVACIFGRSDAVELLLGHDKIDLNATNGSKETPLGIACRAGHLPIAHLLLKKSEQLSVANKIHVAQEDDVGNTSIHYLACRGIYPLWTEDNEPSDEELRDLVQSMLAASQEDPQTSLREFSRFCIETASYLGSSRLLKILVNVASGFEKLKNEIGQTAMRFAIVHGQIDTVKMLLDSDVTKDFLTPNVWRFAMENFEVDIARLIEQYYLRKREEDELPPDGLKALLWPWQVIGRDRELSVLSLIQGVGKFFKKATGPGFKSVLWCHFPANEWDWVKKLCKNLEDSRTEEPDKQRLRCLQKILGTFESSRQSPSFCDPCFIEDDSGSNFVTVLPVIDIAFLDGFKKEIAKRRDMQYSRDESMSPYSGKYYGLYPPRTLDHYYHDDLDESQLGDLNENQVFTRYLEESRHDKVHSQPGEADQSLTNTGGMETPKMPFSRSQSSQRRLTGYEICSDLENQCSRSSQPERKDQSDDKGKPQAVSSSKRILVVSQLWLIGADELVVTLFPQRQGSTSEVQDTKLQSQETQSQETQSQETQSQETQSQETQSQETQSQETQSQETQSRNKQLQETRLEGRQLQEEIQRLFNSTGTDAPGNYKKLYHDTVKMTMQYQSSIKIRDKPITYLQVFSKEITRVDRDIDTRYEQLKSCLGKSDKNFRNLSDKATTNLMHINDVLNEIGIIKAVFEHQSDIWKKMHPSANCKWGIEGCSQSAVKPSSYIEIEKIEKNAKNVQKKASDLATILYGQAGTENALKASEQARYLAIFTGLTVVFSPLSFVVSLLALQVESFTPSKWAGWQVATGCVVGVTATIALCAIPYFWMRYNVSKSVAMGVEKAKDAQQPRGGDSIRTISMINGEVNPLFEQEP